MKTTPRNCLPLLLLLLSPFAALHGQVAALPNPLDFPGQEPSSPPFPGSPGGPLILPPLSPPVVPPVVYSDSDLLSWIGGPLGSPFGSDSWQDISTNTFTFTPTETINRQLNAGNVQFSLSQNQFLRLGTGSLTLSDSALGGPFGGPFDFGILGDSSGIPSLLSLASSHISVHSLRHLEIEAGLSTVGNGSSVSLFATRFDHQTGTAFTGSTINLTGGNFLLHYIDASGSSPVSIQEVLDAYLPNIFFEGNPLELGLDPLVVEPGDNQWMSPITVTRNYGTEQDPILETFIGGYAFSPIPEPSLAIISILSLTSLLRRKR